MNCPVCTLEIKTMKKRTLKFWISLASGLLAVSAWSGVLALNPAVSSFEYTDLANTIVPSDKLALTNSEAWSVNLQSPTGFARFDTGDGTDGSFYITLNAKGASDSIQITSVPLGISMVEGSTYQVSIDSKETLTGDKDYQFEAYRSSDNALLVSNSFLAGDNIWKTDTLQFVAGAADAGQDIYLVITRDSALNGNAKSVKLDHIVLEEQGQAFSDSARVLAFNVDNTAADFEYATSGVAVDLSLSAALAGAASGGSINGSYGTFFDPVGADTNSAAYPWRADGANALIADVTITNTSSQNLKLDGIYFDLYRAASDSVRQIKLDYIGGDLLAPTGPVYNFTLGATAATNQWKFADLTLAMAGKVTSSPTLGFNAMSDVTLGINETATFRLTLQTSTDAATEPSQTLLDNIALIGDFFDDNVLVDWGNPGMFFETQDTTELNLSYTDVTNGNLYVRNFAGAAAIADRTVGAGFYQAQDMYGILQVGNQGALAESLGFAFSRLSSGSPSTGDLNLNASSATNLTDVFQSSLIYYKAEDFYDSIGAGETIASLDMNITGLNGDNAEVHFAVKNAGQWYASFANATIPGAFSAPFPAQENSWGAFTPAGSSSSTMMSLAGVVYDTAGAIFTNVEAVGYLVIGEDVNPSAKVSARVDAFNVQAGPVPTDFPNSSVLAYNADNVREDFEYVKSGVGFSLSIVAAGNSPDSTQGSMDGSLGSFYDPNSADTNSAARPWAGRGNKPFIAEMTIENLTPNSSLDLEGFHFDLYRHQVASISIRRYELEYISGDLTGVSSGLVYGVTVNQDELARYFETNIVEGVTNINEITPYGDFDWTFATNGTTPSAGPVTFNAMADTSLAYGETASFRMTLKTSTDAATESNQARMDNIAFIGTLQGVGFGNWINGFGLAPADKGATADPDGDGLSNLEEYGRNGNPNDIFDAGTPSTIDVAGGMFNYVYPQRTDDDTLHYYVELNNNLVFGDWTNTGYTVTGTNITGGTLDYVTNEVSTATQDAQFIRLIIEQL